MTQPTPIITLSNRWSTVTNLPIGASLGLYEELSYVIPQAKWVAKNSTQKDENGKEEGKGGWDGTIRLFKKTKKNPNAGTFPTGLFMRVVTHLVKMHKVFPQFVDLRIKPPKTIDLQWNQEKYKLRDYQEDAVKSCIEKGRGVLECATGAGKTIIVAKIIQELGVCPFIFYVLTKDLMYQAIERLEDAIPGLKVGLIGDGHCEIKDINIVTVQTATRAFEEEKDSLLSDLRKNDDIDEDEIQLIKEEDLSHLVKKKEIQDLISSSVGLYFDEAHHTPAKTCQVIIGRSEKAYYTFGGSATPVREDGADLVIESIFGQKRSEITASFLIKKGHLIKPEITYIRLSTKNRQIVHTYAEDYDKHIIENDERNYHIYSIAESLKKNNMPTLILVQRIPHGLFLEKIISDSVFISGQSSGDKRKESLKRFANGEIPILIASTIADEGLDIPILSGLILAGAGKSKSRCKQRIGRVIRKSKGKKIALVYDFIDIGKWVSKHSKRRRSILEEEPEFNIKIIDSFSKTARIKSKDLF